MNSACRGSGILVGRLLQKLVAFVFLVAWCSLGAQVKVLIGERGLLPLADFAAAVPAHVTFADLPTIFRSGASDAALAWGVLTGAALSIAALLGVLPRLALATSTLLYVSYAVACRNFLSFQWDNLILECGALAALIPRERRAPWVLFLFRVALFKLYFESGIAKWQSHLGDWQDGSAMSYYYETAPLPTSLAWYAHRLPAWWHRLESWGTLVFELGVPFLAFATRPLRLFALAVLTVFQVVNIATANYGFFSYLALGMHAVLLDDSDAARVLRLPQTLLRRLPRRHQIRLRRERARIRILRRRFSALLRKARPTSSLALREGETLTFLVRLSVAAIVTTTYLAVSIQGALRAFAGASSETGPPAALARAIAPFRVVNTYHLFGHITRERIEPMFETLEAGRWKAHDLHYKPGDPARPLPFVAPHQPRVDFLLWFYGLSYARGTPEYVRTLLSRLCDDPTAVQSLFVRPLPARPQAARVSFYRYHFTTPTERRETGASWTREGIGATRPLACAEQ